MIHLALASSDPDVVRILDVCVLMSSSDSRSTHNRVLHHRDPRTDRSLKLKGATSPQPIPARSIQSPIAR